MKGISLIYLVIVSLLGVAFLILRKKRLSRKCALLVVIAGILCCVLTCILFTSSSLFAQFSTPYGAYRATHNGNKALVIEGNHSALVVATEESADAYTPYILLKGKNGWKAPGLLDSHTITRKEFPDLSLRIDRAQNTSDYYVAIYSIGSQITVLDSNNSVFQVLDSNESARGIIYAYYAWVDSLDETYSITVNGDRIF